jgi:hypothetical protein
MLPARSGFGVVRKRLKNHVRDHGPCNLNSEGADNTCNIRQHQQHTFIAISQEDID